MESGGQISEENIRLYFISCYSSKVPPSDWFIVLMISPKYTQHVRAWKKSIPITKLWRFISSRCENLANHFQIIWWSCSIAYYLRLDMLHKAINEQKYESSYKNYFCYHTTYCHNLWGNLPLRVHSFNF